MIGVVTLTYNAMRSSPKPFVANLQTLTTLDTNYRVLFIDSSSADNTASIINKHGFECVVIAQSEFDHGKTRQLAAELLNDCEIVIYLTQDAQLTDRESLCKLANAFTDPLVATAFGRQLPHPDADFFAIANREFNYPAHSYQRNYADRHVYGVKCAFSSDSFAAYRQSALRQAGGFPMHTIVSEDMYVVSKMLKCGYSIAYVAEATCFHSHNYSIMQEFSRYFDIGVFFAEEAWIKQEFGSAEGEGKKAVIQLFKQILKSEPWLLPSFVLRVVIRVLAFKLGVNYAKLPRGLCLKLTAQKQFWKK